MTVDCSKIGGVFGGQAHSAAAGPLQSCYLLQSCLVANSRTSAAIAVGCFASEWEA